MQSDISVTERRGIWAALKAAVAGEQKDFTSGNLKQAIFMLAVPMVLEMIMESLFAVVDVFYVSRVGVNAVATVGLTESVLMIIYAIAVGLSTSATAFVARRVGEKKPKEASESAEQALFLVFAISVPLSLAGIFFAGDILRIMGASATVLAEGKRYTQIMLGGNIIIMLLFLNNGVFRGAGDAAIAMRVLWLSNLLNMALGPIFIFGLGPIPAMGVTGAAIATSTGRGIGVLFQLRMFLNKRSIIRIRLSEMTIKKDIIVQMFKVALGGMSQFLIGSASWIFLMRITSSFGSSAVAGYTIAMRIVFFTILPAFGLANAAATLVGQNLGAGKPDRAEQSVWTAAFYNMCFLVAISIVFFLEADSVIALFTKDAEVAQAAVRCLRTICLGYIFYAYGMVTGQSFNGAGDTRTPTLINLVSFWVVQIPMAYALARVFGVGASGVYIAQASSFSLLAIISIVVFRKGNWKRMKV